VTKMHGIENENVWVGVIVDWAGLDWTGVFGLGLFSLLCWDSMNKSVCLGFQCLVVIESRLKVIYLLAVVGLLLCAVVRKLYLSAISMFVSTSLLLHFFAL